MTALFDMDGTLFGVDSQMRFARFVLRRHGWRRLYLLFVLPCGILRALHLVGTPTMKRAFLSYAWGMSAATLEADTTDFVQNELLPALYPEVRDKLEQHRSNGDTTVLCSASPDWWVQKFGAALGFTHSIGTPLEPVVKRVPLMPRIPAPGNNKGANKLARLAAIGITHADLGYTDSAADLPMLSICERAVLVNPKPNLVAQVPGAEVIRTQKQYRILPCLLRCALGM